MSSTTRPLTDSEFIQQALNHYFHHANEKLGSKSLGDMERENYEFIKKRSKALMDEMEENNNVTKPVTVTIGLDVIIKNLPKPEWEIAELESEFPIKGLLPFYQHLKAIKQYWTKTEMLNEVPSFMKTTSI